MATASTRPASCRRSSLRAGDAARLVVGNRMPCAADIPWLRRQVNRWMSRRLSQRAGRTLPDTQCGYRLIHLATWASLSLKTERFEVESETLMAFVMAGCPVEFVPIRVIVRGRNSHIRPVADTIRWWKWWRTLEQPQPRWDSERSLRGGIVLDRAPAPPHPELHRNETPGKVLSDAIRT